MKPAAKIIILGDKLLSGCGIDKNGPLLAEELLSAGIRTSGMMTLGEDADALGEILGTAFNEAGIDVILMSGDMASPSVDGVTRTVSRVTGYRRVVSEEALRHLEKGDAFDDKQALIPQKAKVLLNPHGPECGFALRHRGKQIAFLPGGPDAVRAMAREALIPFLLSEIKGAAPSITRTFHTFGLSKSEVSSSLDTLSEKEQGMFIDYSASLGEVTVRVRVFGEGGAKRLDEISGEVRTRLGGALFGEEGVTLEETAGELLREKGETLVLAESCTGGGIGNRITRVAGSSDYFVMGLVAYSNEAKTKLLGVQLTTIEEHGAVSPEVAVAMAEGAKRFGMAGYGLAVTGIAGPTGGSEEKPVGTVYIGLTSDAGNRYEGFRFEGDREEVRELTIRSALDMLRRTLISF